jgi:hypothetical protein
MRPPSLLVVAIILLLLTQSAVFTQSSGEIYLNDAIQAARWIRGTAIRSGAGTTWPADPSDPKSVGASLYAGSPGVILFFIEAYRTTSDATYLNDVRGGPPFNHSGRRD